MVSNADKTVGEISLGSSFVLDTGKTINLAGTARVDLGGQLSLGGGTLTSSSLLIQTGGTIVNTTGSSTATAPVLALTGSTINVTGGDLAIGDASAVNGFTRTERFPLPVDPRSRYKIPTTRLSIRQHW